MTNTARHELAPLAGMRGRLSAAPRPPRVVLPAPVPDDVADAVATGVAAGTYASVGQSEAVPGSRLAEPLVEVVATTHQAHESTQSGRRASGTSKRRTDDGAKQTAAVLSAADDKGFKRVVRDLYDDEAWEDGVNMTWALPRAIRDTVARFGAGSDLANKRAATTVLYLGLLQLGVEIRVNTPEEDRSVRRRT